VKPTAVNSSFAEELVRGDLILMFSVTAWLEDVEKIHPELFQSKNRKNITSSIFFISKHPALLNRWHIPAPSTYVEQNLLTSC
jgi:hypothetical protein